MKKRLPKLKRDSDVEDLLKKDLSPFISQGSLSSVTFEFAPKAKVVNLRVSEELLSAVKAQAKRRGVPYQRYIREALERSIRQER